MGKQLIMAYYIKNWIPYINSIIYKFWISPIWVTVDPAFRLMCSPLDGELDFYLKN